MRRDETLGTTQGLTRTAGGRGYEYQPPYRLPRGGEKGTISNFYYKAPLRLPRGGEKGTISNFYFSLFLFSLFVPHRGTTGGLTFHSFTFHFEALKH